MSSLKLHPYNVRLNSLSHVTYQTARLADPIWHQNLRFSSPFMMPQRYVPSTLAVLSGTVMQYLILPQGSMKTIKFLNTFVERGSVDS